MTGRRLAEGGSIGRAGTAADRGPAAEARTDRDLAAEVHTNLAAEAHIVHAAGAHTGLAAEAHIAPAAEAHTAEATIAEVAPARTVHVTEGDVAQGEARLCSLITCRSILPKT